ncbi:MULTISPECIES: helicase associated domain-containing protein [unclassified Streptomyces]|uniref:helicase associated domain-containing protein n=1 Tax=unclassified Streptomyces TaxID=2593676 RepID=UPI003680D668
MIWDKHDAAWRARLAAAADYHRMHGHLAAPATTPVGAWLAEQRHFATKGALDAARAEALTALPANTTCCAPTSPPAPTPPPSPATPNSPA